MTNHDIFYEKIYKNLNIIIFYMYNCNICNYETGSRTALCNHKKTKKHIQNLEEHEKNLKDEKDNEMLKLKDKEIEELKQKLADTENQKKEFEIKAQVYKELAEKSKNINIYQRIFYLYI